MSGLTHIPNSYEVLSIINWKETSVRPFLKPTLAFKLPLLS